jgi:AcrR family transcriptional regulator
VAGRDTKERIIDTAIEMFNASGTQPVSTNHIASAMGISPGNLYYHFRNKEEIVRAAYERAIVEYDLFWQDAAVYTPSPATMLDMLQRIFLHQWKYRFLQREFPVLVRQDSQLADRYSEMQTRRIAFYRFLCETWIDGGQLEPLSGRDLDDFVMASWLVGESWLGYLGSVGRSDERLEVERGARLVYAVMAPRLTAHTRAEIEASGG